MAYKYTAEQKLRIRDRRRTKDGLLGTIHNQQKARSKRRGHKPPEYDLTAFRAYALNLPLFHDLYTIWVDSDYEKDLIPSFNRISNHIGYSFENIYLTDWKTNNRLGRQHIIDGIDLTACKTTKQYSRDGKLLGVYHSSQEASRKTKVNAGHIRSCCTDKRASAGGFVWKYAE